MLSNMLDFSPLPRGNDPIWLIFFSDGLKPPTRKIFAWIASSLWFCIHPWIEFRELFGVSGEFGTLFSWVEDVHVDINIQVLNDTVGGDGWLRMQSSPPGWRHSFFGSGVPKAKLFTCHWNANGSGHIRILKLIPLKKTHIFQPPGISTKSSANFHMDLPFTSFKTSAVSVEP